MQQRERYCRRIVMPLLVLLILWGCNDKSESPDEPEPIPVYTACLDSLSGLPLIPLQTGAYWKYTYTEYDSLGNIDSTDTDFEMEIDGEKYFMGAKWFKVIYFRHQAGYDYFLARNCDEGFCICAPSWWMCLQFRYPAVQGELFSAGTDESGWQAMYLATEDYELTVPAGEYSSLLYVGQSCTDSTGNPWMCYVAPGYPLYGIDFSHRSCCSQKIDSYHCIDPEVGIIRLDVRRDFDSEMRLVQRWELTEYGIR